jgi:uncharacterized membrane protein
MNVKLDPFPRFFPLDRAAAFSDGVFAVVITILVLGIEVPSETGLSGDALAAVRDKLGHQVLVYFVCFWIVAMYWFHQSLLLGSVHRMDRKMMAMNLMFLMPVTLLPFVTQLMGARRDEWTIVALFALTNVLAALVFHAMWRHVASEPEFHKDEQTMALAQRVGFMLRVFITIMVCGVVVSFVHVRAGIAFFALTPFAAFYGYVRDPLRSRRDRRQ